VDLDTEGGHVLLLEFTSQVALDEGGLLHQRCVCQREVNANAWIAKEEARENRIKKSSFATSGGSVVVEADPVRVQRRLISSDQEITHLSGTTIADKHKLEGRSLLLLSHSDGSRCLATGVR
jgi:hypothetical protein